MKYQLTTQSYSISDLQKAFDDAGVQASISGHGPKAFTVHVANDSEWAKGLESIISVHLQTDWDAVKEKEVLRKQYQEERDAALMAMTHDFGDGRVMQVRPVDLSNIEIAIAKGQPKEWVLADNSVSTLSVLEIQEAKVSGISQGEAIWQDYINKLKLL